MKRIFLTIFVIPFYIIGAVTALIRIMAETVIMAHQSIYYYLTRK